MRPSIKLGAALVVLALSGCKARQPSLDGTSPDDTALLNNAAAMLDTSDSDGSGGNATVAP